MKHYDAVITGAGPIGGYAARKITRKGFSVALIEEHKQPGLPLHCAGLVTSRVLDFFDGSQKNIIHNSITCAQIHAPSGKTLSIGDKTLRALVIDRPRFDAGMIAQAEKEGAEIFYKTKLIHAQKTTKNIDIQVEQENQIHHFSCDLLIGADGAHSTIRKMFHFPHPTEMLRGMGAEITNVNLDPTQVEIFVGNHLAPGFFAWIIPTNKAGTSARVGVCISSYAAFPVKHYFSNLFTNSISSSYLSDAHITRYYAGSIPLGPLKTTVSDRVMLVGDAAAQVKPTSGGGLYPGLLCARHCADVAIETFTKQKFTKQYLKKYHVLWTADIGRELQLGMRFRHIYTRLTDEHFDKYIEKLGTPKTINTINKYGDIDYPSKLALPLLKTTPSLLRLLPLFSKKS